jgi:hypothetical protein
LSIFVVAVMAVACFSFGYNVKMIQNVPFLLETMSFDGAGMNNQACYYLGLRAMCFAACGTVTQYNPDNSPYRECQQGSSISYADEVAVCDSSDLQTQEDVYCAAAYACNSGGQVAFAFIIIASISAAVTLYFCKNRMTADTRKDKIGSLVASLITFASSLIAYLSMHNCYKNFYDATVAYQATVYTNLVVTMAPGVGGIMTIISFIMFAYVSLQNLHMPSETASDVDLAEPLSVQ